MMLRGGHSDACSVELEIGSKQFVDGGEDRDREFRFGLGGAGRVWLDCRYQNDASAR